VNRRFFAGISSLSCCVGERIETSNFLRCSFVCCNVWNVLRSQWSPWVHICVHYVGYRGYMPVVGSWMCYLNHSSNHHAVQPTCGRLHVWHFSWQMPLYVCVLVLCNRVCKIVWMVLLVRSNVILAWYSEKDGLVCVPWGYNR